ncbi:uncharacterized protein LOC134202244 [Armigeres subalbatus]|uniref:uncharacterized protein LOC134202244 n=1 Tax=Armigeres subalbatus TaxID=124917 RepID=UPI002ED4E08F
MARTLEAERAEKAEIAEQLKKLQAVVASLQASKETIPSDEKDETEEASVDLEVVPIASSTRRPAKTIGTLDESRFLSSVNQLSISSITVPECKPLAGDDEIHRHTFEMWKDLLIDCMALAGIEDEATKFTVFKLYFGSSSDVMFQRRKLALMEQKSDESDLAFITRVGETAQLCDFDKTKEFEEIVKTIAEHAKSKEVRVAALKMVSRNGTFTNLVDKVREIQAIRMNEDFFAVKHRRSESTVEVAILAPVKAEFRNPPSSRRIYEQRADNRYLPYNRNYPRYNQRFPQQTGWRGNRAGMNNRNVGHIQRACLLAGSSITKRKTNQDIYETETKQAKIEAVEEKEAPPKATEQANVPDRCDWDTDRFVIATIGTNAESGIITAQVAGMQCDFLIDSGAQVNTLVENIYRIMRSNERYSKEMYNIREGSDRSLKAYASEGEIMVLATFEAFLFISDDRPVHLETFYVVKNAHRSLLGRSTALRYSVLKLGFSVPVLEEANSVENGLTLATVALSEPFPKFNLPPVKIDYDKSRPPCRNIFSNIPQAMKPMVEKRLLELIAADIIEPVTQGMDVSFCSSMLAIPKGKHDIRLVIDLRGPNKYIQRTPFAMPTLESILPELNGAAWFSTIDMSNAFFHVELDRDSRHLTNFYTEFGLFRCVRLPFGLCNAPDIFQEVLQRVILGGCSGVKNYLDDILVFGSTKEIHDANLEEVLNRLRQHNVKLNDSKCVFSSQAVQFVGFLLTSNGWSVTDEKDEGYPEL